MVIFSDNGYERTCNECLEGLYLMTNSTLDGSANLSFCVPDCSKANPAYTNNPTTGTCECKYFIKS